MVFIFILFLLLNTDVWGTFPNTHYVTIVIQPSEPINIFFSLLLYGYMGRHPKN